MSKLTKILTKVRKEAPAFTFEYEPMGEGHRLLFERKQTVSAAFSKKKWDALSVEEISSLILAQMRNAEFIE